MTKVSDEKKTPLAERLKVNETRALVAQALRLAALLCAAFLAAGALLIALGGNDGNVLVDFVKRTADRVDFGFLDRTNGVFEFDGKNRQTKNALVNWGLAAVIWLVIGRFVSGIVRK